MRHLLVGIAVLSLAVLLACESAPQSWTVTSDNNVVGRRAVDLESGEYRIDNDGCVLAELAEYPSDDLVISVPRGKWGRMTKVETGSYVFRAIGNQCKATLEAR